MQKYKLSSDQALNLLKSLATSESFQQRFKLDPKEALAELGIPTDFALRIQSSENGASRLASTLEFAKAHRRLHDETRGLGQLKMIFPLARLNYGDRYRSVAAI